MLWDVARKVPSEKLNGLGTPSRFLLEVDLAGTVPRFLVLFFGSFPFGKIQFLWARKFGATNPIGRKK